MRAKASVWSRKQEKVNGFYSYLEYLEMKEEVEIVTRLQGNKIIRLQGNKIIVSG